MSQQLTGRQGVALQVTGEQGAPPWAHLRPTSTKAIQAVHALSVLAFVLLYGAVPVATVATVAGSATGF